MHVIPSSPPSPLPSSSSLASFGPLWIGKFTCQLLSSSLWPGPHRALLKGWSVLDWGLMRRGNSLHWMIWRVAGGEQSNINRITVFMGKHICVKICINVAMEVISSKGGYTVTLVVLLIYRLHTLSNWKPKPSSCRHSFAALQVVCL